MVDKGRQSENRTRLFELNPITIPIIVGIVLLLILLIGALLQQYVEINALPSLDRSAPKEEYEIAKLVAEIRRLRSDTFGSLFWLKAVALIVTVAGALSGYLYSQDQTLRRRLEHEKQIETLKNVDAQYQNLVQELANDDSAVLRATAAVKLGNILAAFPAEWRVYGDGREQQEYELKLIELTKKVLACALAIETNDRVLKTLTIAIALHRPQRGKEITPRTGNKGRQKQEAKDKDEKLYADLQGIDLSGAKAADAYWADVDFSKADFYRADVTEGSLKGAKLHGTQFRETKLSRAVLQEAKCQGARFKLADLRGADLFKAELAGASFEAGVKVYGTRIEGATGTKQVATPGELVDISEAADESEMVTVREWLSQRPQNKRDSSRYSLSKAKRLLRSIKASARERFQQDRT